MNRFLSLYDFKEEKHIKEFKRYVNNWEKKKPCNCKVGKGEILNCIHLNKALKIKFKKERKIMWAYAVLGVIEEKKVVPR